ncbi:YARHG domain-containing protein [Bradyrhizobium ontarionense]|uniref:YARHG domain-containing protein n=1 Tax=Bradyrhizobium ontarionense TaxID=2898149 RepID=A0ABY3R8Y4_9BRAD|nr:YARHG domain-containing protein [Bradyrhizobium sp. A19]UFZ03643.1 YARHG domain-containing protein [Bradyrhizobium sp. A19]
MGRSAIGILVFLLLGVAPCAAGTHVALVVGNSDYQSVSKLANPANDARLVAETFQRLGFTLIGGGAQLDLDKPRFDQVVQTFGRQLLGAEVAVFYYAGHGIQLRGTNYLVPVSANPSREADVDFMMVDVGLILRQMEAAGTKLNIVILDACRNNPFGGRGLRSGDGGLAQIRAPEGTILSYATQPGNVALDGDDGHSPYTRALVDAVQRPGLDVLQAFNQVGLTVKKATASAQQPWIASSPIDGAFYFAGPSGGQPAAPVTAAVTPSPGPAPALASARPAADFVFPDSDQRLLSPVDVKGRTKDELRVARNEIFARRGRYFSSSELTAYFNRFPWYAPSTWDPALSPIEAANVDFLDRAEKGGGPASDFIIPDSDRRLVTSGELARLSKAELRLAKNEIFARRGRFFDAPDLKAHFGRFAWYVPSTWNPTLNGIEEANVKLMDQIGKRP